ncbi:DUF1045 domain-containing protein [Sagittula salina]|uniref:DUF1045 domain-containing protein n=1 Tax=Sagittula salina TaxID=2820268 RepID=A0A940MTL9_9RHOB|nr:DUF1045 domain-containing protein [Sagittula salina]MBP0484433.1 DUF1045 domain-containing protein [Sagittula salina]
MSHHSRFAVYYMPPAGPLADFGARWLGWDAQAARALPQDAGRAALTETPRKYGFHATLKPPFVLAPGTDRQSLHAALTALAARTAPAQAPGLALTRLGRWFALTPAGDTVGISRVAAACVTELDTFRAPTTEADLARRRKAGLTPAQEAHLARWGYPYVLDQFRFHLTLTGKCAREDLDDAESAIRAALPPLPQPFAVPEVCLCGERDDGRFELLHRYALTG